MDHKKPASWPDLIGASIVGICLVLGAMALVLIVAASLIAHYKVVL